MLNVTYAGSYRPRQVVFRRRRESKARALSPLTFSGVSHALSSWRPSHLFFLHHTPSRGRLSSPAYVSARPFESENATHITSKSQPQSPQSPPKPFDESSVLSANPGQSTSRPAVQSAIFRLANGGRGSDEPPEDLPDGRLARQGVRWTPRLVGASPSICSSEPRQAQ